MITTLITPAWLGSAARELLDRLATQRYELSSSADNAARCAAKAALYERQACVWRVLSKHTDDLLATHAMCDAGLYATDAAREYRQLAKFWRDRAETSEAAAAEGDAA
ncbi:hypothetical protein [Saccharopolyspora spinosa]|uniref:Uncharacterized protein n=1 Tax=Saccharopolyspora spinosa TaxID=60894 RepID=A0A2N3XSN9_SACSN|nr:hypothetical protein [Saccharopolyspora spinosa]PKW13675.1 hypothetical protein A8926_1223 [Saccharopolyspora spinosa]